MAKTEPAMQAVESGGTMPMPAWSAPGVSLSEERGRSVVLPPAPVSGVRVVSGSAGARGGVGGEGAVPVSVPGGVMTLRSQVAVAPAWGGVAEGVGSVGVGVERASTTAPVESAALRMSGGARARRSWGGVVGAGLVVGVVSAGWMVFGVGGSVPRSAAPGALGSGSPAPSGVGSG